MNARQLEKLGIPRHAVNEAVRAIQLLLASPGFDRHTIKDRLMQVAENPQLFVGDPILDELGCALTESGTTKVHEPIAYRTWGDNIDEGAHQQMRDACRVSISISTDCRGWTCSHKPVRNTGRR